MNKLLDYIYNNIEFKEEKIKENNEKKEENKEKNEENVLII